MQKTPFSDFINFLHDESKLGFLKEEQVDRLVWYINTYFIDEEKLHIINAFDDGELHLESMPGTSEANWKNGEQYYNEKYEKEVKIGMGD